MSNQEPKLGTTILGIINSKVKSLKRAIAKNFPVNPANTTFFENYNYGNPQNVVYVEGIAADNSGQVVSSQTGKSLIINVEPSTTYYISVPSRDRFIIVESASDFVVGQTYTKLSYEGYDTGIIKFTTGATAKKILHYFRDGSYDYDANKDNIVMTIGDYYLNVVPAIKEESLMNVLTKKIEPSDTTFFECVNFFDPNNAQYFDGRYIDSGTIKSYSSGKSVVFPVEPNTKYYFYAPSNNRGAVVEGTTKYFNIGSTYTLLTTAWPSNSPITFTTGSTAKYVCIFFYYGATYDWDTNKNSIVLNKDLYYGASFIPHIDGKYLVGGGTANGAKMLIFGDSITQCCDLTINANNETTAYSWKNPSSFYTDGQGNTVNYSMWPKILRDSQYCGEIRNYAFYGAQYKTDTRASGEERKNLQYQIDVAMNDLDNPNNVFSVANFVPDIVIFALGTNDAIPADTYDSVMNDTVYDGSSIDVETTMEALDDSKSIGSARKAFMRIKQAFPMAQIYVVLPLQTAYSDGYADMHTNLKKMAQRYGCIIIDGTYESGITRDFNVDNGLGTYLVDGLHPNEKGHNLMARMIISSIKSHYMPLGQGFN